MYNKISASYKKKHIYGFEDEPPEKKLISDGDILIKQLAKKQRNTKVDLDEQLTAKSRFYKSTEEVSLTSYTSGSQTLEEFNSVLEHSDNVEELKSCGLSDGEIELYLDFKSGKEHLKNRHKNMNESVLKNCLEEILNKIKQSKKAETEVTMKSDRLKTELTLATKPRSIETKLLKFALGNQKIQKEKLPSPMDQIRDVERHLMDVLSPPDIKKIRKKARQLGKQIDAINHSASNNCIINNGKPDKKNNLLASTSKWDVKEIQNESICKDIKVYTCKPQNVYTIKDGQIVKIGTSEVAERETQNNVSENIKDKLTLEEIKKIPKFENYDRGIPSKVLYLKNLSNGVDENDLQTILDEFAKHVVSINVMKGRMRGQAFIEFGDEEVAEKVLHNCNGTVLKNRPVIIQFGKGKHS